MQGDEDFVSRNGELARSVSSCADVAGVEWIEELFLELGVFKQNYHSVQVRARARARSIASLLIVSRRLPKPDRARISLAICHLIVCVRVRAFVCVFHCSHFPRLAARRHNQSPNDRGLQRQKESACGQWCTFSAKNFNHRRQLLSDEFATISHQTRPREANESGGRSDVWAGSPTTIERTLQCTLAIVI